MTKTLKFSVNSYQICLGQTKLDDPQSGDPDDFRRGSAFFIELGVSVNSGFRSRFRDNWRQVETFTLYFMPDDELTSIQNRGAAAREWDNNRRVLEEAYARFRASEFDGMQRWLRTEPEITLSLIGEDSNPDICRRRLEGNVVSL